MTTQEDWIEAPRWARVPECIRRLAQKMGVVVELETEKRLVRETVFFKVSGDDDDVGRFMVTLAEAMRSYNREETKP